MKIVLILLALLFIVGCSTPVEMAERNQQWREKKSKEQIWKGKRVLLNISYLKDEKTGLCFAIHVSSMRGIQMADRAIGMAHVPCNQIPTEELKR